MEMNQYLKMFEALKDNRKGEPSWLLRLREEAMAAFVQKGFPTIKDEAWRYTDLTTLKRHCEEPAIASMADDVAISRCKNKIASPSARNDMITKDAIDTYKTGGVEVMDISEAIKIAPELLEKHFGRYADPEKNSFTALNAGLFSRGTFIRIDDGVILKDPIRIVHAATSGPKNTTFQPRMFILIGKASKVAIVETYTAGDGKAYFTNAVTEIVLEEGAQLEHCKIQREHPESFHIATTQVVQRRGSSFISFALSTGARLMRNDCRVVLAVEGASCELNGLYLGDKDQVLDHQTFVDHQRPDGKSDQFFKGLMAGNSQGVFRGHVMVRQDAQRTDAHQTNKNLLLSNTAKVDTQPQLEILADDVKCSHGATIGQLQEDELFYLRSRGIGEQEAGRILAQGFAQEVIERSSLSFMKEELTALVNEKLKEQLCGYS